MWVSTLCVLGALSSAWCMNDEAMVVEGEWTVHALFECPDADEYRYKISAKRSMMNRTTDCYDITVDLPEEITATSHGVLIEMYKKVDGGSKLQYTHNPSSLCDVMNQYAQENFQAVLANIGLEHRDCPIPKGELKLKKFPFNYKELPETSIPGDFIIVTYVTKGFEKCSCFMMDCSFQALD